MHSSRRNFIKTATGSALAAPWIGWKSTSAGAAPSKELRFANFGAAGRAWNDFSEMLKVPNTTCVAVAEVDTARATKLQKAHPDTKIYQDWRRLLDEVGDQIDAVVVGTPDHMHAPIAISAMQLGLHVYCEKPLTRTLHECRTARELAAEKNLTTQMGIQIASTSGNRTGVKLLQEGVIGKVLEVHSMNPKSWGSMAPLPDTEEPPPATLNWDEWIGVSKMTKFIPREYHPSQWRKRIGYGTGTLGDMGCHIYHPWFMGLNMPETLSVTSLGPAPVDDHSWPLDSKVHYRMKGNAQTDGDFDFTWYDGKQRVSEEAISHVGGLENMIKSGTLVIGTEGALTISHSGSGGAAKIFRDGQPSDEAIEQEPSDHHHTNFASAIRGEISEKPRTNFDYAGPMTEAVLQGTVALRLPGEELKWDAASGKFTNSDAANKLVHDPYREGWEVKGV
tara:strand:+ start:794 stop:2137 length:1344 start_codon:yes stop_codon:yes gene_type:complete